MNLKNKLRNQMIILTILSFFIFLFFFLRINVYTYTPIFRIIYTIVFISIILIQWIMYFSQNKKIPAIHDWLENFLAKHPDIQHLQSLSYATKYAQKRIFALLVYYFCLNIMAIVFSYYIIMRILFNQPINMIFLLFIVCLLIIVFVYAYIYTHIEKTYYQSYLYHDYKLYIQMTYHLCCIPVFQKAILSYNTLMNVSSALGRLGYPQEAYDFLLIWKQNAKRLPALTKLYYYEHCIAHLAMLQDLEKFEDAYTKFQTLYQSHPRLHQRENIKTLTLIVSLYVAYIHNQPEEVLQLKKQILSSHNDLPPQIKTIFEWAENETQFI